jgi:hypothetical protein
LFGGWGLALPLGRHWGWSGRAPALSAHLQVDDYESSPTLLLPPLFSFTIFCVDFRKRVSGLILKWDTKKDTLFSFFYFLSLLTNNSKHINKTKTAFGAIYDIISENHYMVTTCQALDVFINQSSVKQMAEPYKERTKGLAR